MSTSSPEPKPGQHRELSPEAQLARARPWEPAEEPVVDDLTDDEEREFLDAVSS